MPNVRRLTPCAPFQAQKEDRGEMDDMYSEYKQVKAKVKLLEVLVAKHRSRAYTM